MRLLHVLQIPSSQGVALLSAALMLVIYVYAQLLGIVENLDVWLATIPPLNLGIVLVFSALFGITFAYQYYLWKRPKTCSATKKISGAGTTGVGTFGIFLVAQCPACASIGTLFLPFSAISFLADYGWIFNLLGIGLLLFTLNYLGAFKNE
jgi:hypothetical protein